VSHGGPAVERPGVRLLSHALAEAAYRSPEDGIVHVSQADGSGTLTPYPSLLEEAERILGGLRGRGLQPGDEVLLQVEHCRDFLPALWGSILGGFVPVPLTFAPSSEAPVRAVSALQHACRMSRRPVVLACREAIQTLRDLLVPCREDLGFEELDDCRSAAPDSRWHEGKPDDLAMLLLTSGSTGLPKGVMLSHRNVLSSIAGSAQVNGFTSRDISLNWLAMNHVGALMRSLREVYLGSRQVQARTHWVLEDPLRWLDWIERYRVTTTWAPNFAFGLIAQRSIHGRRWDLSSLRSLWTSGESIAPRMMERFLDLLAPSGLRISSLHTAWGMTEACFATFSHDYLEDFRRQDRRCPEVGRPIPGISLRIVDDNDRPIPEETVGRLQIQGPVCTRGYYGNELNAEAFTPDGWLRTGDLGFLHSGRLTITGREKDVIIMNGLNISNREVESAAEEVEGVEVSYTAACGVRRVDSDTDELAVFFHTSVSEEAELRDQLTRIRRQIIHKVGVNPNHLIPVDRGDIPKTEVGKIQRAQLSQRFESGEFEPVLKRLDVLTRGAGTLPDWFYRKIWRPRRVVALAPETSGRALVFMSSGTFGETLTPDLRRQGWVCTTVEPGTRFEELGPDRFRLDPATEAHYGDLLETLKASARPFQQVLHLWGYDKPLREGPSSDSWEQEQHLGAFSLVSLTQALARVQGVGSPVRLTVVACQSQGVRPDDPISCEQAVCTGMVKTLESELPWLECRHIDLQGIEPEADATLLLRELRALPRDRDVAFRDGRRLIARLTRTDLRRGERREIPFVKGGTYLLNGSPGEFCLKMIRFLVERYGIHLVVVGAASETDSTDLAGLPGEVVHAAVAPCDAAALSREVCRVEQRWGRPLDGILHLAAVDGARQRIDQPREALAAALRPQLLGAWNLHRLLEKRPGALFLTFFPASASPGRPCTGAAAVVGTFLESLGHLQRRLGLLAYSFAWSEWPDSQSGSTRAKLEPQVDHCPGPILPLQALQSTLAGLHHEPGFLLIGLKGGTSYLRSRVEGETRPLHTLRAHVISRDGDSAFMALRSLEVRDRFGAPSTCEILRVTVLPSNESPPPQPQSEQERRVASIFAEVLGLERVGVDDDFFSLGGSSVQVVRAVGRMKEIFPGRDLSIVEIFRYPNVRALTEYLAQDGVEVGPFASTKGRAETRSKQRQDRATRAERRARSRLGD
jgi:acyl-CoA synthetase (AMP-forming)/AMP-acid ligase II